MKLRFLAAILALSGTILVARAPDTLVTQAGLRLAGGVKDAPAVLPEAPAPTLPASKPDAVTTLTSEKLTNPARVLGGFTNGITQVIVSFRSPPGRDQVDFKAKASRAAWQAEIRKQRDEVLAMLPAADVRVGHRFDNIAGFSAEVTEKGLRALQQNPRVIAIEPVVMLEAHLAQGIPLMKGLTYRATYNGAGLSIAICDTGVDYTHPRLGGGGFPNSKVLGGWNFGDGNSNPMPSGQAHGTCCAGIAAGNLGTVGDYIGGVAYNAKLYALKISGGSTGSASTAAMVAAWDWCVTHQNDNPSFPIMVISTSFGGGRFFATCDGDTPSMTAAANNANAAGITVVASSGNDGYCESLGWPACISSVISVGAVYDASFGTYTPCVSASSCAPKIANAGCPAGWYVADPTAPNRVTAYANVASFLTVLAPSERCSTLDIVGASGYSGGDYFSDFGGTSAACPYTAGAVAVLQSAAKTITGNFLSAAEVRNRLITDGDLITDTKVAITKPRVNIERMIQSLAPAALLVTLSNTLSAGNGDQILDLNECNDLAIVIRNDGNATATNITATLTTSTPGLTLALASSSYPNLAPGNTATNASAFRLSTGPAFICGTPVNLTLTLTYVGGTNTIPISLVSGAPNYVLSTSGGASIVPGTTDSGNHGDDLNTTLLLPFPYTIYGQTFTSASVSANGNLQFGGANSDYGNVCLPTTAFPTTIFAFWDDLRTDGSAGAPQGVFTSTSGSTPNRIFNIEWRASYYDGSSNGSPVNFEIRLYENQLRFDVIYGVLNSSGATATAGAQKNAGASFLQYSCNAASLSSGLQLTFLQTCGSGGGACSTTFAGFTGSPTSGLAPLAVTFTNSSTGGTNYLWNFGDGNTSSATNASNIYSNAGTYSVTLTAVGDGGTNALTRTNYIVVTNPPPPVASFTGSPASGQPPLTVSFTNLSTGSVTNSAWNFGDGNMSLAANPSNVYSNAGSYNVTLTVTGPGGTNALTLINYIVVTNPPPPVVADFVGAPTLGPAPLTVHFTNLTSGATSYAWDFGDSHTSTGANPSNLYSNAGSYTVSLTAVGPGRTNSLVRSSYVVVTNPPAPQTDFTSDTTNGVAPLMVNFTNHTTGVVTRYAWDFGDGNTSTNADPSNTYSNAGSYSVSLTAVGPGGTNALAVTNYIIVTNPPPAPPLADFTADATNGVAPLTVNFTNLTTGVVTDYAWSFGDGNTSTNQHASNIYANAGSYTVSLNAIGPTGTNARTVTNYIVVALAPPAPLADFTTDTTIGLAPLTVNFTNLTTGVVTDYAWDFGDGNTSTNGHPSNIYSNAGSYTVSLSASGPGGANAHTVTNCIVVTNPPPAPPVAGFAADTTSGVAPMTVHFTNLTSGVVTHYAWVFGDGQTSTNANPSNTYSNAGSYTVTLTAAGPGGTNAANHAKYIAVASPAHLVASPATLSLGLILTGATVEASFAVSNMGGSTLSATSTVGGGGPFGIVDESSNSVPNRSFALPASGTTNLAIRFAPVTAGVFSNNVVFGGNGGDATNTISGKATGIPVLLSQPADGGEFIVSFETVNGLTYVVQYKDLIDEPLWQTLQTLIGDGSVFSITNAVSTNFQRYFRLSVE